VVVNNQPPFNSRLKFNDCLGGLFRHGQKAAFEAICVTLQYAMDLGEPIFDVVHHADIHKRQQQQPKIETNVSKEVPQTCRKMP
jgi:hypothetical protein